MNNIKKICSFLILSLIIISCTEGKQNGINVTEKKITATIEPASMATSEDDELSFTVNLPEALPSDFDMRVRVTLNDGRKKDQNVNIPEGMTSVSSTIFLPPADDFSVGFNGLQDYATIQVMGGVLAQPIEGTSYIVTSEPVSLYVFDKVAPLLEDKISVLFDWDNAGVADLDIYMLNSNNDVLGASETGSRYENLSLDNNMPDGDYSILVSVYATTSSTVPYKLFIKQSDGKQTLAEGTLENIASGDSSVLVSFNKSGNMITLL